MARSPGFHPKDCGLAVIPPLVVGLSGNSIPPDVVAKLRAIMKTVATTCGFSLVEALCPREDGTCLVQSGASWCNDVGAELFHKYSADLLFPINVGVPGRCLTSRQTQFHADVTNLPSTVFLRAEMAVKANLRGLVAIPVAVHGSTRIFVMLFFTGQVIQNTLFVWNAVEVARNAIAQNTDRPQMMIPKPLPQATIGVKSDDANSLAQSRSWLRCEIALAKPVNQRTQEDAEDIMKLTRKLEFFRHMPELSREILCRTMVLVEQPAGVVLSRFSVSEDPQVWRLAISGRIAVISMETLSEYPVWFFEEGQTFARSYLNMFVRPGFVEARIETITQVKFLEVRVAPELQHEFRVWTRPLWYEELAKYFHVSINEAADFLGICPSAIKRICRRHGLNRWPHRRIISIDRQIQAIENKIMGESTEEGEANTNKYRKELMYVARQKILSSCNLGHATGGNADDDDKDDISGSLDEAEDPAPGKFADEALFPTESPAAQANDQALHGSGSKIAMYSTMEGCTTNFNEPEKHMDEQKASRQSSTMMMMMEPQPYNDMWGGVEHTHTLNEQRDWPSQQRGVGGDASHSDGSMHRSTGYGGYPQNQMAAQQHMGWYHMPTMSAPAVSADQKSWMQMGGVGGGQGGMQVPGGVGSRDATLGGVMGGHLGMQGGDVVMQESHVGMQGNGGGMHGGHAAGRPHAGAGAYKAGAPHTGSAHGHVHRLSKVDEVDDGPSITIQGGPVPDNFRAALDVWNQRRVESGEVPIKIMIEP